MKSYLFENAPHLFLNFNINEITDEDKQKYYELLIVDKFPEKIYHIDYTPYEMKTISFIPNFTGSTIMFNQQHNYCETDEGKFALKNWHDAYTIKE